MPCYLISHTALPRHILPIKDPASQNQVMRIFFQYAHAFPDILKGMLPVGIRSHHSCCLRIIYQYVIKRIFQRPPLSKIHPMPEHSAVRQAFQSFKYLLVFFATAVVHNHQGHPFFSGQALTERHKCRIRFICGDDNRNHSF